MRRILAVSVALVVPAVAYAQTQDLERPTAPPPVRTSVVRTETVRVLPPLKLPNIPVEVRRLQAADRSVVQKQLVASQGVLRFWAGKHAWLLAKRHEKCSEVPWARSCTVARASERLHQRLATVAQQRLDREIPLINDWRTAVRWVQKIYPGTERRIMQITGHEGGSGPWVWWSGTCGSPPCLWRGYHVGNDPWGDDTVGGWVQFRYSTFIIYYPQMLRDLKRRGYILPDLGWARPYVVSGASTGYGPWLSPLGQALTTAYMHYSGKQGSHWNF